MWVTKELLEKASALEELTVDRGKELINIVDKPYFYPENIYCEFSYHYINVYFEGEYEDGYVPTKHITLSLDQLSMSNEEWKEYIEKTKQDIEDKKRNDLLLQKQKDIEKKRKQYEDLKKELGYE